MKKLAFFIFIFIVNGNALSAQNISGIVIDEKSNLPVAYVNIGIEGKNTGTVSDVIGRFNLRVDSINSDETVLFSCIGYQPVSIKIADLKNAGNKNILMQKKYYELREVIISPKIYKQRTLGVVTRSHSLILHSFSSFKWGIRSGSECGILIKIKKSAVIKRVNINIAECTYDTVFCRLNIYRVRGEMNFENILTAPVYINISKDQIKDKVSIDLQSYNIVVDGDFLVTLEFVKDLGLGAFSFWGSFTTKTYSRWTSQGKWDTFRFGVGLSVEAEVEK